MRTNIVIDEDLVRRARELTGIKTKRELVEVALRELILLREQGLVRKLRGKLRWQGDLEALRVTRRGVG